MADDDRSEFTTSEELDEDALRADPLEEGMDPPEQWSAAERFGTTATEQREGEDLDHRLAEEQPDVQPDRQADRPMANLPENELDETIDDRTYDEEKVVPEDSLDDAIPGEAIRRG